MAWRRFAAASTYSMGMPEKPWGRPSSPTEARARVLSPRAWKTPARARVSASPPSLPLKAMRAFPGNLSSAGR